MYIFIESIYLSEVVVRGFCHLHSKVVWFDYPMSAFICCSQMFVVVVLSVVGVVLSIRTNMWDPPVVADGSTVQFYMLEGSFPYNAPESVR